MEFREYVDTLYKTDLFGRSKIKFAGDLFMAAAPAKRPKDETINSWMYKGRKCSVKSYFSDESINENRFISYFRQRTKVPNSFEKIQKAFQSQGQSNSGDAGFCVDLETKDPEAFYWSLLNQFQRVFGLPETDREEKPSATSVATMPREEEEPTGPVKAASQFRSCIHKGRDMW